MNKHWPNRKSKYGDKKRERSTRPNLGLEPLTFYREEKSQVKRFWDLLKSSVIGQVVVTVCFVATVCYLYATGQEVPPTLIQFTGVVVGYFFGAKQQQMTGR